MLSALPVLWSTLSSHARSHPSLFLDSLPYVQLGWIPRDPKMNTFAFFLKPRQVSAAFPVLFSLDCHPNSSWSFQKKKKLFTLKGVRASDPCYFCSRKGKWVFLFLLPQSCVGNGDHKGTRAIAICSAVKEDSHSSQTFHFIFPTSWEARLRA